MVVVVAGADEAAAAVEGGADRIVARLPQMVGRQEGAVRAIAEAVGGRVPLGLWLAAQPEVAGWLALATACGAEDVFLPFDGSGPVAPRVTPSKRLFAILPAETTDHENVIDRAATLGFHGFVAGDGLRPDRLLHAMTISQVQQRVGWGEKRGLAAALGAMEAPDIPRLLALAPAFLIVDDAVHAANTASGRPDPARIRFVRELMGQSDPRESRSLEFDMAGERDRIFIRDWTIPVHLGAYSHERAAQRVRFSVEVEVLRTVSRAADLRHVVSYDLIVDAISRSTATHVDLVETIAEDVASAILAHPRAARVDVTVEKLDLGPGSMGCRIVRTRESRTPLA